MQGVFKGRITALTNSFWPQPAFKSTVLERRGQEAGVHAPAHLWCLYACAGAAGHLAGARALASFIRSLGVRVGVALGPDTPDSWALPMIQAGDVDMVR